MAKFRNKGKTYGRLTVLRPIKGMGRDYRYECQCSCGNIKIVPYVMLCRGEVKSCGCLQNELKTRGGQSRGLEYSSWRNMHGRV
jgi:hypothetical protein